MRAEELTRVVIPMLEEIAAKLTPLVLASVNGQAQPGELIVIYVRPGKGGKHDGRAIIVGPRRLHRTPPLRLDEEWRYYAAVRVTDDSAEVLPMEVSC